MNSNIEKQHRLDSLVVDYEEKGAVLHFRIFDADGKMVVDVNETSMVWLPKIANFSSYLDNCGLWPPRELTRFEKDWVIAVVTSIVSYTREDEREAIFVFDRHRPGDAPTVLQCPLTNYKAHDRPTAGMQRTADFLGFLGMAFDPDGQALISIDFSYGLGWGFVRKWDLSQPDAGATVLHELRGLEPVTALSPDGKMLAAGGVASLGSPFDARDMYAAVKVWDLCQIGIEPIILSVDDVPLQSLAFSSNSSGRMLAAGNEEGDITLWHLDRPETPWAVLRDHRDRVWSLAFSPDDRFLASGSEDQTVRIWDLHELRANSIVLQGHRAGVSSVAFSPDGGLLASGSDDGTARLWIAQTELLADMICKKVRRNLTEEEWRQYVGEGLDDWFEKRTCPNLPPGTTAPPPSSWRFYYPEEE